MFHSRSRDESNCLEFYFAAGKILHLRAVFSPVRLYQTCIAQNNVVLAHSEPDILMAFYLEVWLSETAVFFVVRQRLRDSDTLCCWVLVKIQKSKKERDSGSFLQFLKLFNHESMELVLVDRRTTVHLAMLQ